MTALMAEKAHNFMCRNARKALNAQTEVGVCLSDPDCPVTRASVAKRAGWHINTLATYFPPNRDTQPTKLPLGSLWDLLESGALPDDLAALLMPDGFQVVAAPESIDVHEIGRIVAELHALKTAAHHPESPAGVDLSDCEVSGIAAKAAELKAVA